MKSYENRFFSIYNIIHTFHAVLCSMFQIKKMTLQYTVRLTFKNDTKFMSVAFSNIFFLVFHLAEVPLRSPNNLDFIDFKIHSTQNASLL